MWAKLLQTTLDRLIAVGALNVTLPDGRQFRGGCDSDSAVSIHIHDWRSLRKIIREPELAVGEAYVDGTLTIANDDLSGFLALAAQNLALDPTGPMIPRLLGRLRRLTRKFAQSNSIGAARNNVAHHYDLSGELYELFLDADRQYSCAYFTNESDSLEQAQTNKKRHIANKLLLRPGMRVLDIGCGWGGMAMTLAKEFGANVVGVTLSREQHKIASERVLKAGLQHQIEIRLQDYRDVTESFDRIVSVGMFEHVGVPHFDEYFTKIGELLAPDGCALVHSIGRSDPPGITSPWISKYIFPGGYCPAMSETMAAVERANLIAADVEVWRLHYAETLRHWRERFEANIDAARALYDDAFCRMWRFYLIGCEMTFRHNRQVVFQFQLTKQLESVPLTRDYLYKSASQQDLYLAAE